MSKPSTLQALACYARDHFGEDGFPYEKSIPTSFDIVMEVYAREAVESPAEECQARATNTLSERLEASEEVPAPPRPAVEEFVRETVTYLQSQYPEAAEVERDQQMLSHLFWGHLVEARHVGH